MKKILPLILIFSLILPYTARAQHPLSIFEEEEEKSIYRWTRDLLRFLAVSQNAYDNNMREPTSEGVPVEGVPVYEYYPSGNLKSMTLSEPDVNGNIKYEYYDEDFYGDQTGRYLKITRADGSYDVFIEYWTDTDQVKVKEEYDSGDNLVCTYEYDESGKLICAAYEWAIDHLGSGAEPQINDNGYVVWSGNGISFYDGSSITQLGSGAKPQINDNGYVVWRGSDGTDWEIFLYDGSSVIQLTDNSYGDDYPQINNNGYVVWRGWDGTDWEIFLYDGSSITQLTDNSYHDYNPQINNNGYVVWAGFDGNDYEIFLYDGSSVTQLTNNSYDDGYDEFFGYGPQINNNGYVVWAGFDGNDYEIFLYDGSSVTQLTNNSYDDGYDEFFGYGLQINANGYVVWYGWDGTDYEIFLYDGSTTRQLTDNDYYDDYPQINANGYVVWSGNGISFYDGSSITQLGSGAEPQINDNGYVVWDEGGEIFFATPPLTIDYGYYASGMLKFKTLSRPDENGNIYYHYIDEDFASQGYGRVDGAIRANPDGDGALGYIYTYHAGTDVVEIRECYETADYTDASSPIFTTLLMTYEYYASGNLRSKTLSQPDGEGNIKYGYYDEDFYGDQTGRYFIITRADGSFDLFVEYWAGTDQVKVKEEYDSSVNLVCTHEYYVTGQITDNSYDDGVINGAPRINANGYVVWAGYDGTDWEIFLYDGSSVIQLTDNSYGDYSPQINANGYVVWDGNGEIFLYDGSTTTQLTGGGSDNQSPQINANGYVVWRGSDGNDWEIFLYDGSSVTQITDNSYWDDTPQINANGYVVWNGFDGIDTEIFLYDGSSVTQLTYTSYIESCQQINDNGYVVWNGYSHPDSTTLEIFLYDGSSVTQITDNSYFDGPSQINNNGYVVWHGSDGNDFEIFLYDGSSVIQLTDNSYDDYDPQINANGYVVWRGYDGNDYEIFLYDGSSVIQLTDNSYDDMYAEINDNGYVLWQGYDGTDYEIFFATPHVTIDYYYYASDYLEYKILSRPDGNGIIYYHHIDEDFGGQGYGRVDKEVRAKPDTNNAIAYTDTYDGATGTVLETRCYQNTAMQADYNDDGIVNSLDYAIFSNEWGWQGQPGGNNISDLNYDGTVNDDDLAIFSSFWLVQLDLSNPVFTTLLVTYEYYASGNLKSMTLSEPDEFGNIKYEYYDEDFYGNQTGRYLKITRADGSYDVFVEYWTGTDQVKIKEVYDSSDTITTKYEYDKIGNIVCTHEYDASGKLIRTTYEFAIDQLTDNSYEDIYPQINANGYVVWVGYDGIDYEIFLYDGSSVTQLTDNSYTDWYPQINTNGYVVWYGWDGNDYEIFLYDGSSVTQLTDNSYSDEYPQINADGYVVWYGYDGNDDEIFLYDGSSITQLTDNSYSDQYPQINADGYVVWMADYYNNGYEIFLYDGSTTTQLTNSFYDSWYPQINANGYVVWYSYDLYGSEIFLYDGSSITQLTDNSYGDGYPQINADGYVVWRGWDGNDYEIFLYDGSSITQLTDNSYGDRDPQINANGYVVWRGWDGNDYEIFLYDGFSITQLTDNSYDDRYPRINANGEIVWYGNDEIFTITLALTIGYYYYASDYLESKTLSRPDEYGNIYYHYIDEDFGGQGYGRIDKEIGAKPDTDNAIAYEYIYDGGTGTVLEKRCYQNTAMQVDYNDDGIVNSLDYAIFSDNWGWQGNPGGNNIADLNYDGSVNDDDLAIFNSFWLAQIDPSNPMFTTLLMTYEYDTSGNPIRKTLPDGTVYTYYIDTGFYKSLTPPTPDADGNVYYHYINENFGGQGYGRINKQVLDQADADGAIAYVYTYHAGTDIVQTKECYEIADYSDPFNPVFTNLLMTYEYYASGNLKTIIRSQPDEFGIIRYDYYESGELLSKWLDSPDADNAIRYDYFKSGCISGKWLDSPDADGDIKYEYYDEDFYGGGVGRFQKAIKVDGSYEVFVEYWTGTDQIKIKEVYDSADNLICTHEYDQSGKLIRTRYEWATDQLTDNSYSDWYPQINDNGYVVWQGWDGNDYEIFLYDGSSVTQLTDNSYYDYDPQINDNGYVVWYGYDGNDDEIFLYDGTSITQLTDNSYYDGYPQINSNGYVVWVGYDGTDYEIFLYDGTSITQLTDNSYGDYVPQINDNGYVVWEGYDGTDYEIFLYDGSSVTQLTDNSYNEGYPQINANGYVVWEWSGKIFLYDGSSITQLGSGSYPQINENGYVVWDGQREIFFATPPLTIDYGYYTSDYLNYKTLSRQDEDGKVYYHYIDEDFASQGYGKVDKEIRAKPDTNNAIAYEYIYDGGTGTVLEKRCYQNTAMQADYNDDGIVNSLDYAIFSDNWGWQGQSGGNNIADLNYDGNVNDDDLAIFNSFWLAQVDPSDPVFTNLVLTTTYEYYASGMRESKVCSQADQSGKVYYHYIDEDFASQGYGRVDKEVLATPDTDGAIAYEYIYDGGTGTVLEKRCYEDAFISGANPADLNDDGMVNMLDYGLFSNEWGWTGTPGDNTCDFNSDGIVNERDLDIFNAFWLMSQDPSASNPIFANLVRTYTYYGESASSRLQSITLRDPDEFGNIYYEYEDNDFYGNGGHGRIIRTQRASDGHVIRTLSWVGDTDNVLKEEEYTGLTETEWLETRWYYKETGRIRARRENDGSVILYHDTDGDKKYIYWAPDGSISCWKTADDYDNDKKAWYMKDGLLEVYTYYDSGRVQFKDIYEVIDGMLTWKEAYGYLDSGDFRFGDPDGQKTIEETGADLYYSIHNKPWRSDSDILYLLSGETRFNHEEEARMVLEALLNQTYSEGSGYTFNPHLAGQSESKYKN